MTEAFSIRKMFSMSPIGFAKVIGLAIKACILLVVLGVIVSGGIAIKERFFPTAPSNVNNPEITVEDGGTATYNVIQNEQKRKLEFFLGAYGNRENIGGFGGLKW